MTASPEWRIRGRSPDATPEVVYPPDSGVINMKVAYGAKGDGVTDDSVPIIRAIAEHDGRNYTLYFPNGVYLVSRQLAWKDETGGWGAYLSFQGQSQSGTIIRLVDRAPGFADPSHPKAVIYTASQVGHAPDNPGGIGNEAYLNNINDLTLDSGTGNPGAIGIYYLGSNRSQLSNVTNSIR